MPVQVTSAGGFEESGGHGSDSGTFQRPTGFAGGSDTRVDRKGDFLL